MPTYEYRCNACGHEFETMHGMTAPVLRKCPKCARLKLERLISGGAGVIFKGSGFYETDYKRNRRGADSSQNDSSKESSKDAGKSDPAAESKSEPKAESKADAKGESKAGAKGDGRAESGRSGGGESKSEDKPKKDSGSKKD